MEWSVHLARRRPGALLPLLLAVAAALALAYAAFQHFVPMVATGALLLSAVSEFLLPVHYRLTPEGATRRNGLSHSALSWSAVRRVVVDADGIRLSPLPAASVLDPVRGIYLRFPEDETERARLVETVRVYWAAADPARAEKADVAG